jgi:hypothetical protein
MRQDADVTVTSASYSALTSVMAARAEDWWLFRFASAVSRGVV